MEKIIKIVENACVQLGFIVCKGVSERKQKQIDNWVKDLKSEINYEISHYFCRGCKWEFDFNGCQNDHKSGMLKRKDGSLKCIYCAWYKPKFPITHKEGKK